MFPPVSHEARDFVGFHIAYVTAVRRALREMYLLQMVRELTLPEANVSAERALVADLFQVDFDCKKNETLMLASVYTCAVVVRYFSAFLGFSGRLGIGA